MSTPLWHDRRVLLCVGSGGVGKTTASAALALAAAAAGKRTLVMTIDPARRLAHALGLDGMGNVEVEIDADVVGKLGVELKAPLWAMMPDVKRTFDDLINRLAPTEERRQAFMNNRIYQKFSTVLAGSLEYAAVEKLYEVYVTDRYDLIVLDTPPIQNAVEFFDAPKRVTDFLDHGALQWFLKPYVAANRLSKRIVDFGSRIMTNTLGRVAGGDILREIADFLMNFQGMYDGFRDRSKHVQELLGSDKLAVVHVTSTQKNQLALLPRFRQQLQASKMQADALVVNRVNPLICEESELDTLAEKLAADLGEGDEKSRGAVIKAALDEARHALSDRRSVERMRVEYAKLPLYVLPELRLDAHDLDALVELHRHFLAEPL